MHHGSHGGVLRTAAGHHLDLVKELERQDSGGKHYKNGCVPQLGESDIHKLLPFIGPIHNSGFVQRIRDLLQPRQVDDHLKTNPLPDRQEHDCWKYQFGIQQPVVGSCSPECDCLEEGVDQPLAGVI